jgi:hypothetical protein
MCNWNQGTKNPMHVDCVFVTRVPTFKLESDTVGELMCSDKADLKSSKVQVVDNEI